MTSDDVTGAQDILNTAILAIIMLGMLGAALAVMFIKRVIMHFVDKGRISEAARQKGWQDVDIAWAPFAPGFLFERRERHYRVSYLDELGTRRSVYCKISLLTGVFWRG